jgi:hypothetical protein
VKLQHHAFFFSVLEISGQFLAALSTENLPPRMSLERCLVGPEGRFGHLGEEKILLSASRIEIIFLCYPAFSLVTILIKLSIFMYSLTFVVALCK